MAPTLFTRRILSLLAIVGSSLTSSADTLSLKLRSQVEVAPGADRYHTVTKASLWDMTKTAVILCDMWDDHYCRNSAKRVAELAPRMNEVVKAARAAGALIIHCPSGCMPYYADTPQRKLGQSAPKLGTIIPLEGWCHLDSTRESEMPVKMDTPCDDVDDPRPRIRFYTRQIETLEIAEGDAICESIEPFFLLKQRDIENVLIMGVHTNMCVLGRPFGIRQLVRQGVNVALVRDMTDTMYNPIEPPFVNHFTGNDLIVSHIERHWCPTVTSGEILDDGITFRFPADTRPHLVIVAAEEEYKTEETLPPFALAELGRHFKISVVYGDPEVPTHLPGARLIREADVILLSVRRRNLPKDQLDLFRDHLAAGKSLVGIRTASHPFHQRDKAPPEGLDEWRDFDETILGGHYTGHHGGGIATFAKIAAGADHSILSGITTDEFPTHGSLYQNTPLPENSHVLMTGRAEGIALHEPVAWTHTAPGGGRVFYTSLGHPADFEIPAFRTLLRNAIHWAADEPTLVPPKP